MASITRSIAIAANSCCRIIKPRSSCADWAPLENGDMREELAGVHSIVSSESVARDERVNGGLHPRIISPGHSLSELVDGVCA
jgi:hypothetical protein